MSLDAQIINFANHGISYLTAIFSKISLATLLRYAKSPLSILIPMALYPKSFKANATAQKFNRPLLFVKYISMKYLDNYYYYYSIILLIIIKYYMTSNPIIRFLYYNSNSCTKLSLNLAILFCENRFFALNFSYSI